MPAFFNLCGWLFYVVAALIVLFGAALLDAGLTTYRGHSDFPGAVIYGFGFLTPITIACAILGRWFIKSSRRSATPRPADAPALASYETNKRQHADRHTCFRRPFGVLVHHKLSDCPHLESNQEPAD
jgi:hypothetical protein